MHDLAGNRAAGRINPMKCACLSSILLTVALLGGCGTAITVDYPNRLIGAGGQRFTVEDLEQIAQDPVLDDEGKREAFRELGIEDEHLIDALLTL